jgi:hypothetical protein
MLPYPSLLLLKGKARKRMAVFIVSLRDMTERHLRSSRSIRNIHLLWMRSSTTMNTKITLMTPVTVLCTE